MFILFEVSFMALHTNTKKFLYQCESINVTVAIPCGITLVPGQHSDQVR